MIPEIINHVIFNTGRCEQIYMKNVPLPPYEKVAAQWTIHQAAEPEGIDVGNNVILKLYPGTDSYIATFAYGTYVSNEIFLISCGAITKVTMDRLWDKLCEDYATRYNVSTPLTHRPGGPIVVDIILPCANPEANAYLYSSDCYNLCARLGRSMLFPDSIKI